MSRKFLLLFGFASAVLAACTQDKMSEPSEEVTGEVFLILNTEGMAPQSKAVVEVGVPKPEDLTVEIFKNTDLERVRLYRDTYNKAAGKSIKLNCADYTMSAFYGDSLAVGENRAYYEGCADFSLTPQNRTAQVEITAKIANVRVSVEYGDNLLYDYPEFYAKVRSETAGGRMKSAEFYQDEYKKKTFVPYGTLYFELYAKVDGQWKYFPARPVEPKRGDDVVFKVDTERLYGSQGINVTISQLDKKDKSYEVPATMLPQDSPEVSSGSLYELTEMVQGDPAKTGLRMDLVVDGNIKECWLNVSSDYLAALGVPERVDLASDRLSSRVKTALESVGLKWMDSMYGRRFAYVDFSGITKFISETTCNPDNLFSADFSIDIIDQRHNPGETDHEGTFASKTYSFVQGVPAPSVSVSGFENGGIEILEGTGVTYDGLKAKVVAKGRIAHCYLYVNSPYLREMGVPTRVDLCEPDSQVETLLRELGVDWPSDMSQLTEAEIDFSGLAAYMDRSMYSASKGETFATFNLLVENKVCLDDTKLNVSAPVGSFKYTLPSATVSTIQDYNVWAKKIYDFNVNLTKGNPNHLKLQYSTDNATWTDITENTTLSGTVLSCSKLTTESNTLYNIRAIYHNNPDLWIGFNSVTTEAEAQIPNSDFEDWVIKQFSYVKKTVDTGTGYRDWYVPTENWWAVNSKRTMPSETNGNFLEETQPYKVFPTVSYSVNNYCQGIKSAQIMTIGIGNTSTGVSLEGGDKRVVAGEMFIGTADDNGNHSSDGHAFGSRPSKISFKYQYKSISSENFKAFVRITLGDRVVTKEFIGEHSSSWSTAVIDLTEDASYDVKGTPKATDIYISFLSTTSSSPAHEKKCSEEVAGKSYNLHRGSVLRIDDLQLIYE